MKKISFFLPTLNIGGIERVFICYANNLIKRDYKVDFVLCKKEGLLLNDLSHDVHLVCLEVPKLRDSFIKLRQYIKSEVPDLIISGGDYPNMILITASLGLHLKTKIVISQHNYYNLEVSKLGFWAKATKYWMRILYPFADKVIAISDGIKSYLLNDIRLSPFKVVNIYNPLDIEDVQQRSSQIPQVSLPEDFIVFIGRISAVKNIGLLLRAFDVAEIGRTNLVIVGDGQEYMAIQKHISMMQKKERVFCVGSVSNPLPILLKAKALVLPSFSEAFPTILLEAMCLNKPIVATPTKGAIEILNNTNGAYISRDFNDKIAFASLIEIALQTQDLNISEEVSKYSVNSIMEKFIKFFL